MSEKPSFMETIEEKYGEKWVQKYHSLSCYSGSNMNMDVQNWVINNPNVRVQTMVAVNIPNSTELVAGIFYLEKEVPGETPF